jgi:polyferredoxin
VDRPVPACRAAVDGDRNAQIRLQNAPWGPAKIAQTFAKWSIWLAIAFGTGGAWIFYFADAPHADARLSSWQAPLRSLT